MAALTGGDAVQMAIPWTNQGITPSENMVIGFDMASNGDTGGGRTVQSVGYKQPPQALQIPGTGLTATYAVTAGGLPGVSG